MKKIILLFCTLILISSAVMGQAKDQVAQPSERSVPLTWKRYTVKGEDFSVTLPTLPSMVTAERFNSRLQKRRKERQVLAAANGVSYVVEIFKNGGPTQTLEEFIADENAKLEIDPTTERNLTINGVAGKEYSPRKKSPPGTVQFFATEKRLYRFFAIGADDPGVKQFFSSIVLGKTDGIKVSDGPGLPLESTITEKTYTNKEVDVKARLLSKPEPGYTEEARQKRVVGIVVLRAVFTGSGQIADIRVVQGLPHGLTEQSIKMARKIKFIPAMKDGNYVSTLMQLEYNFNLY